MSKAHKGSGFTHENYHKKTIISANLKPHVGLIIITAWHLMAVMHDELCKQINMVVKEVDYFDIVLRCHICEKLHA